MSQSVDFTSFGKGELSPYVRGRIDTLHYYSSAEKLQNMIVRPYGDVVRRAGTKFIAEVKNLFGDEVRLIEFIFSTDTSYIIEVSTGIFRFFKDDVQLTLDLSSFTDWTTATEYAIGDQVKQTLTDLKYYFCTEAHTSSATADLDGMWLNWVSSGSPDYAVGDFVDHVSITYECILDHPKGSFQSEPGVGSSWELYWILSDYNGFWSKYDYATNVPDTTTDWILAIPNPYEDSQIWDIDYAQKDDTLKIVHQMHDIAELRRYTDTGWQFVQQVITGPPWAEFNDDKKHKLTRQDVAVGATGTLTSNRQFFTADMVGRYVRYGAFNGSGEQGYLLIKVYNGPKSVNAEVIVDPPSALPVTRWSLNAFYEDNYPAHVTFHESRLVLSNSPVNPQKEWFSKSFVYNTFNTGDSVEFGFDLTLNTEQANKIEWTSSGNNLAAGTFGGEFISNSPSDGAMNQTNKNARSQSSWGSVFVRPKKIGDRLYFVQRGSRKLREMYYIRDNNNYDASDMTKYSEHITLSGIVDMDYQRNQDSLLWCVLENGKMAIFSRDPEDEIMAWTSWVTDGDVKSIRFTPNPDGLSDRGTMIVERTIKSGEGTATKLYLESFDNHVMNENTELSDLSYVDSGVVYDEKSSATDTNFDGLEHLEGKTVSIYSDGIYQGTGVVGADVVGEVENIWGAWLKAVVGLPFESIVQTNPLNAQTPSGMAKGKIRRIHSMAIDVYKSLGMDYSSDGENWFPVGVPEGEDEDAFFTGTIQNLTFEGLLDYTGYIYLRQSKTYPMNLNGIYARVLIAEGK